MGKTKKIKQWRSQARRHADRAEQAAERSEAALQAITELTGAENSPPDKDNQHSPTYTAPQGSGATPPAAEVP